ncbi:S8 family serine peptidase [Chengkuizengella sp. SCS-71B]|uniref:S8 family serine peptidase n=1 Tax=Chengkuizengella sp. SCS-71B TaxID=3115290 RepID=UPI0032C224E1
MDSKKVIVYICIFSMIFSNLSYANPSELLIEEPVTSYLIGLNDEVSADEFKEIKLKDKKTKKIKTKKEDLIVAELTEAELLEVTNDDEVLFVEENAIVEVASIDKPTKKDVDENNQLLPWGIQAIGSDIAFKNKFDGKNVNIAILDTGIADHSDLKVKDGISFVEGKLFDEDDQGHGTHVAGTIAALDNRLGVLGVAPGADLYAVKVLDEDGNGSYAQVIEGIQWAIDNKMDIISMSFGGKSYSQALHEVIKTAEDEGILVISAGGNLGEGNNTLLYPSLFPEVISVGAVDKKLERADYSSTGLELDLVAPGTSILSTLQDGNYGEMTGTSMAVPHVTGAAALIWESDKKLTADEVKNILYNSATPLGDKHRYGFGLVNVAKALELIDQSAQGTEDAIENLGEELTESEENIEEELIDLPITEEDSKGFSSKERIDVPELRGDLLLIAAYFYPTYINQLNEVEKFELFKLDTELLNKKIASLNSTDFNTLEELLPVAISQYKYHTDREGYIEEIQNLKLNKARDSNTKELKETFSKASVPEDFTFSDFNNEYTYKITTDDYVDSLYRTANRRVTDVYLPGKNGFDLVLQRHYNSLESKVKDPRATSTTNKSDEINPEDVMSGFIANGWSLNLPYLEWEDIKGDIINDTDYLGTDSNDDKVYESSYKFELNPFTKMVFTLEDGSSYEFRRTNYDNPNYPTIELVDYPYGNNVSFEVLPQGDQFWKGFNFENGPDRWDYEAGWDVEQYRFGIGNIMYEFDADGKILRKYDRILDDELIFEYDDVNNNITISDSLGRRVSIYRNNDMVIYQISVFDRNGSTLKEIHYKTTNRTEDITYRRYTSNFTFPNDIITESISYWRLDEVNDIDGNVLEAYNYYPIDSTTLADFNLILKPYAHYTKESDGNRIRNHLDYDEYKNRIDYWESDRVLIELDEVYDTQWQDYAEIPYLLLKNVYFNNGTIMKFNYDLYDPFWDDDYFEGNQEIGSAEEQRNTTKLFIDRYALQHISYHAVNRIDFMYEDPVNSSSINYVEYAKLHQDHGWNFKEYWKNSQIEIPRLRNSSRFGDRQTNKVSSSTGEENFYYYQNNGTRFLLTSTWTRDLQESELQFIEDEKYFLSQPDVVIAYDYSGDHIQPTTVYRYSDDIPDYEEVVQEVDERFIMNVKNVQFPEIPYPEVNVQAHYFEYDNYGELKQEVDPLGNTTVYEYTGNFHQLSNINIQSQDGLFTYQKDIVYGSSGAQNDLPELETEIYTYQDPFLPTSNKTDTLKKEYVYEDQLLKSLTSYASGDQFGNESIVSDKEFTYTEDAKLKTETSKVTLEEGQSPTSLTIQYDYNEEGNLREIIYSDTSEVEYEYDYLDRITSYSQVPFGGDIRTTTVDYVNDERKVTVNTPDGEQIESFYNPFGLNVKQVRNVNEVSKVINEIESNDGIITDATKPYGNSDLGTSYTYDNLNRVMSMEDAEGNITRYFYANTVQGADGKYTLQQTSKVVYPNGKEEISYYDVSGNLIKFVERDVNGDKERITTNQYSSLGQLLETSVTSEGKTQTNQFGYDGTGNLIFLEDDLGQTYKYVYNPLGQVVEYYINNKTEPEVTKIYNEVGWLLTETSPSDDQETYTYNNKGLIETFVDKKGQTFTYTYSPYNEVEHMTVTDNTGQEVLWEDYTYDPETRLPTELANSEGQTLSYTYDEWKRLNTQQIAGNTYTFNYDDFDRLNALVYPDLKQVDYTHDNLSRIKTVSYDGQLMGDYDYTISTDGTSLALNYEPLSMGFQTDINPFGELISHEQKDTGSITWAESFGYDGLGNIEYINQNGELSTYQYDDLNRIIQEDVVEGIQTYTYDEKGNRKTMEGTMKLPLGPREFTYNALNQLSTFKENDEETTYQYYVGGLRATKESVDGDFTRYIYYQGNVIEELDQVGNPTARNIWGNQLLYREDMTSNLGGYYFYNGHGDVVKVIADDGSKDVLKEYDYDIWGNVLSETSHETKTFDNPFQYTGEIYDEESGLIYLRARYYDPSMGRFITEDTYEGTISNPLSMNLYTYVSNNPLKYIDPSGHSAVCGYGGCGAGLYGPDGTHYITGEEKPGNSESERAFSRWFFNDFLLGDFYTLADPNASRVDKGAAIFFLLGNKLFKLVDEGIYFLTKTKTSGAEDIYSFQKYKGSLMTEDILSNSRPIINGGDLKDSRAIAELTKDGSDINDWAKMSSNAYETQYGRGEFHFYQNQLTGEISSFDSKLKIPKPKKLRENPDDEYWIIDVDENFNYVKLRD